MRGTKRGSRESPRSDFPLLCAHRDFSDTRTRRETGSRALLAARRALFKLRFSPFAPRFDRLAFLQGRTVTFGHPLLRASSVPSLMFTLSGENGMAMRLIVGKKERANEYTRCSQETRVHKTILLFFFRHTFDSLASRDRRRSITDQGLFQRDTSARVRLDGLHGEETRSAEFECNGNRARMFAINGL